MFQPLEQYPDTAKLLEEHGYEGVGLADHVVLPIGFRSVHPSGETPFTPETAFPDTFTTIAAMAMVTSTLRFMSYAYIVPMRDPFTVAKQVATASILSRNRVVLGAGSGWLEEEFDVLGHSFHERGKRFDEALDVIEDFWIDGKAASHGSMYDFAEAAMFPAPKEHVPVWVGGKSRAALRRAARHDGWLGMNYPLDEIETLLEILAEEREAAPSRATEFEVFVIPNALPSLDLYRKLADWGVTATMGSAWRPDDPAFHTLDAQRVSAREFADRFIDPLR
jgi:probable F420-dependent oxidoreductase